MVRLTIDGVACEAAEGALLIDALSAAGKTGPHLCHDDRLIPSGACRLCIVHVKGQPHPVASCSSEVAEGMVVQTRSVALDALCRTNLELIAARYPRTAYAADPRHPFHRLLAKYDVPPGGKFEDGLPPMRQTRVTRFTACWPNMMYRRAASLRMGCRLCGRPASPVSPLAGQI